jgi:hypothetical protein
VISWFQAFADKFSTCTATLWRLASEDEELLGRARIQPHGLEAVVPRNPPRKPQRKTADDDATRGGDDATSGGGDGGEALAASAADPSRAAALGGGGAHPPSEEAGGGDGGGAASMGSREATTLEPPLEPPPRDVEPPPPRASPPLETYDLRERKNRATRHAGVIRSDETRKRIATAARERWRSARETATAQRTAEVGLCKLNAVDP